MTFLVGDLVLELAPVSLWLWAWRIECGRPWVVRPGEA